jgi:phage I-like protein
VVDYEHATLKAQESGDPAPASGWLKPRDFNILMELDYVALSLNGRKKQKDILRQRI